MKSFLFLACLVAAVTPALAGDFDRTEKSPLYEIRLRVPGAAMAIVPLRDRIMALYKSDAGEARKEAQEDKESDPSFHPYSIDTNWRVTFDNAAVISLSGNTYADTGGAHPNEGYQTLVWDKRTNRAVAINDLFVPAQARAAMTAISDAAVKAWTKLYVQRSGQQPGPRTDLPKDGIGPDAEKLKTYALTYAKGQTVANGIVLLYGAGQAWPHVLGDFRLSVPAQVFAGYLAPQWKPIFGGAH